MTIQELFNQNDPFLISHRNHEIVIYPLVNHYECLDKECLSYGINKIDNKEALFEGCVLDYFDSNSSCMCSIQTLMGNGCTCGAIIRYNK